MGWMIQDFNPGKKRRYLFLLHNMQTGYGAHAASYSVNHEASFLDSKVAVVWGWQFTPSNCKVKKDWSFTSTHPACLQEVDRHNFTSPCSV